LRVFLIYSRLILGLFVVCVFLLVVVSVIVSTYAVDCLEQLISVVTCSVSSRMLKLWFLIVHIVPTVHVGCQAAVLLESQKSTADAVADLSSSCFKLNSLQLRALLQNYQPARDELPISPELIERAVVVAQNTADANARREGSEVKLLEDLELQLPFLLPEDGYSCDFVTGCNAELVAFLEPLRHAGIAHASS